MINVWASPWTGKHMLWGSISLDKTSPGRIVAHIGIPAPCMGIAKLETGRWLLSLPPHPEGAFLILETRPGISCNEVARWVDRLPGSDAYRVGFEKITLDALSITITKAEPFDTAFDFMLVWED